VPRDGREGSSALVARPAQGPLQPIRMVHALSIACDLGANDASGVFVVSRAAHAADRVGVENLDFESTGRRTIVRTGRGRNPYRGGNRADGLVHRQPSY